MILSNFYLIGRKSESGSIPVFHSLMSNYKIFKQNKNKFSLNAEHDEYLIFFPFKNF